MRIDQGKRHKRAGAIGRGSERPARRRPQGAAASSLKPGPLRPAPPPGGSSPAAGAPPCALGQA